MNWILIRNLDTYIGAFLLTILKFLPNIADVRRNMRSQEPRSILLVKFWGIGNLFMLLPSLIALRRKYPAARLDILTLQSNKAAAETLRCYQTVRTIDTGSFPRFLRTAGKTLRDVRSARYDVIIDFEQFARFSAIFCALAGGKRTIGFDTEGLGRAALYASAVPYDNEIHVVDSYYSLAAAAGAEENRPGTDDIRSELASLSSTCGDIPPALPLSAESLLVVMHTGTSENFRERRWPARNYAELADRLIDAYGVTIVLTGGEREASVAASVLKDMRRKEQAVDASGKLSFLQYFCLIGKAGLVISADTAAVHLASATGTPVAGLYGPNTPVLYGPWGGRSIAFYQALPCSPCITNYNAKINTCRHPDGRGSCMAQIGVEEVFAKIAETYFTPNAPYRIDITPSRKLCALS